MSLSRLLKLKYRRRKDCADDLSAALGVGYPTVTTWYYGTRVPHPKKAGELAAYLGVPIGLITRSPNSPDGVDDDI